jgi:hypothetical protein
VAELRDDGQALDKMEEEWARATTLGMLAHALYQTRRIEEPEVATAVARRLAAPETSSARCCGDRRARNCWPARVDTEATALAREAVDLLASSDCLCVRADTLLDQAHVLTLAGHAGRRLRRPREPWNCTSARAMTLGRRGPG